MLALALNHHGDLARTRSVTVKMLPPPYLVLLLLLFFFNTQAHSGTQKQKRVTIQQAFLFFLFLPEGGREISACPCKS